MKRLKTISVIVLILFSVSGYSQETKINTTDSVKVSEKVMYTCSMHPEIISDHPGICSKCGMELIKKTNDRKPQKEMKMKKMGMMHMGIFMGVVMVVVMIIAGKH